MNNVAFSILSSGLSLYGVPELQFMNSGLNPSQRLQQAWVSLVLVCLFLSHLQATKPSVYSRVCQALSDWHNQQVQRGYQANFKEIFLL